MIDNLLLLSGSIMTIGVVALIFGHSRTSKLIIGMLGALGLLALTALIGIGSQRQVLQSLNRSGHHVQ